MIELAAYLIPAIITALLALIERKENQKKNRLEVENLQLENEQLKKDKEETEVKLQFLNRIMDLEFINKIGEAANRIFDNTKADRFLILVAKNGKEDFNIVSVVFEAHKKAEYRINAIARYRNVRTKKGIEAER